MSADCVGTFQTAKKSVIGDSRLVGERGIERNNESSLSGA
ncbi:hypothetical protein Hjap01_03635 [Haloarcula japonica]